MATNSLFILTCIAEENDIEMQMTINSQMKMTKQNQSSSQIERIHRQYDSEEEEVRNEMNEVSEDRTSYEYAQLTEELREIEDDEDEKVEKVEESAKNYEDKIDVENDNLTSRLESLKADHESMKDTRKQNIEDTFGYFQN